MSSVRQRSITLDQVESKIYEAQQLMDKAWARIWTSESLDEYEERLGDFRKAWTDKRHWGLVREALAAQFA